MSFLTPLYILGALAVAGPVVFHLIRRAPRGEVPFSSLMFLAPTPPRLTRRSRLDQLWLLSLRAAALCLLATAFARPFLRQAARLDPGGVERQRVVVLVDTSASMRRGDLWPRARALAEQALGACGPNDQVAVLAFDATTRPLLGFDEAAALGSARRRAVARARLERAAPTWASTRLDQALIDAVAELEDLADANEKAARTPRRVVLVSDLQHGSRLDALGDFEWPADVALELKTVIDRGSNAGIQWLADSAEPESPDSANSLRVRVTNEPGSRLDRFRVRWCDADGNGVGKPLDVYVPPGEGRAVKIPRPDTEAASATLRLEGDQQPFDDTLYVAVESPHESSVISIGPDQADDPAGLSYYLRRVFADAARVRLEAVDPSARLTAESDTPAPARALLGRSSRLVVLNADTTLENARRLRGYLEGGGTLLYVLSTPGPAASLAALAGSAPATVEEVEAPHDALLGEIAFDHPLFAPLASAQFNDFTKIRFWKHRRLPPDALGDARVLARFDDGDPALIEKPVGQGRLFVLTSGWSPSDSQLARSSKFVLLMNGLLDLATPRGPARSGYRVLDRVPLPVGVDAKGPVVVRRPDGAAMALEPGATTFDGTDAPGVYTVEGPNGVQTFAVNLDPAESKTTPLPSETLEQYGCRIANGSRVMPSEAQLRQLHNAELEGRQKLWRWLILAAILVLIVETWLAGRVARPRAEALAT